MLELVFGNAYFCFDNRLYLQLIGLFMGCKPSPLGAIIRVYMFERNSIYIDIHYLPLLFYKRYVDDGATLARSEEHATNFFNSIAQQDPDGRLEWEVDFPDSEESFTPFLSKIFEAYFIYNQKPEINDKSEIKLLQRFLVNGDVIHSH